MQTYPVKDSVLKPLSRMWKTSLLLSFINIAVYSLTTKAFHVNIRAKSAWFHRRMNIDTHTHGKESGLIKELFALPNTRTKGPFFSSFCFRISYWLSNWSTHGLGMQKATNPGHSRLNTPSGFFRRKEWNLFALGLMPQFIQTGWHAPEYGGSSRARRATRKRVSKRTQRRTPKLGVRNKTLFRPRGRADSGQRSQSCFFSPLLFFSFLEN